MSEEQRLLWAGPIQAVLDTHRAQMARIAEASGIHERTLWRIQAGHNIYVRRHNAEAISIAVGSHITQLYP